MNLILTQKQLVTHAEEKQKEKEKEKEELLRKSAEVKKGEDKNWNEKFQQILEMSHADATSSMEKYIAMSNLAHDFVSTAKRFTCSINF